MEYTTDKSLLEPQIVKTDEKETSISFGTLGRYKNEKVVKILYSSERAEYLLMKMEHL